MWFYTEAHLGHICIKVTIFLRQLRKKEIKKTKSKSKLSYKIDFATIGRFEADS